MTDKEVRRLRRIELLEILIDQKKEIEELRTRLEEARKQIERDDALIQRLMSIEKPRQAPVSSAAESESRSFTSPEMSLPILGGCLDSWVGKIHWRRDGLPTPVFLGFPCDSPGKESRRPGFDLWIGKIPWRRERQPTLVFFPGKFYGERSLAGCTMK